MACLNDLNFNPGVSLVMHIDLNSCFARIEQQANPLLRGKPVAVAAYTTPSGCILAPSVEAKKLGVKVGMRVKEGLLLCPDLIILPTDPWKYRFVHIQLHELLSRYTDDVTPKSIDEFVLNFTNHAYLTTSLSDIAMEIKQQIKNKIGEWLTVSIGLGPNRFLAKTASNLHKPDGLDEINIKNHAAIYSQLQLTDLCGIDKRNQARLNSVGIYTVTDFLKADLLTLKAAFCSIQSYYWYLRLRGWEIDDFKSHRQTFGNSYSLPKALTKLDELSPIIMKLTEKAASRMRLAGYSTRGVHLALLYSDFTFYHKGRQLPRTLTDTRDIYRYLVRLYPGDKLPVKNVAISCFDLSHNNGSQLSLFEDTLKKNQLTQAVDEINKRWGQFVITPATLNMAGDRVVDRISFGGIKDLENFLTKTDPD